MRIPAGKIIPFSESLREAFGWDLTPEEVSEMVEIITKVTKEDSSDLAKLLTLLFTMKQYGYGQMQTDTGVVDINLKEILGALNRKDIKRLMELKIIEEWMIRNEKVQYLGDDI